jgi:hypothetical protein
MEIPLAELSFSLDATGLGVTGGSIASFAGCFAGRLGGFALGEASVELKESVEEPPLIVVEVVVFATTGGGFGGTVGFVAPGVVSTVGVP